MPTVTRVDDPDGVTAVLPLQQSERGGSGSFLVRADDERRYWCKALNNPQHPRVPVNEQIVGRLGKLIGVATCDVALVRIPEARSAGHGGRSRRCRREGCTSSRRPRLVLRSFASAIPDHGTLVLVAAWVEEIRERAGLIAKETGMDEEEAVDMLAIATGLSDGCLVEEDEDGRPIPREPRTIRDS